MYATPEEAFAARTEWQGDCLVWTGSVGAEGYGYIRVAGKTLKTHRYAWERVNGFIPAGMHIDHICHNRACCSVKHLRVLTPRQNQENRCPESIRSSSGYLNVSWHGVMGKWWARLTHKGTTYYGGFFDDIEEANLAAIALRNRYQTHNDLDR